MGKLYGIGIRQADGGTVYCLFKARARSPKGKGADKVWLINCSIEAFDEIDCQRVFELHSVEGYDGCFSTHYVYLRLDQGFFVHFQVQLPWWNAPQK